VFATIELPVWVALVVAALASLATINHFFLPGIRWLLRRRVNRVIKDVNSRLSLEVPTFQLTKREVLIDRLTYDPEVLKVAAVVAAERNVTRDGVMAEITTYAREMVPAFNAWFYFRFGFRMARRFLRAFYKVRLGFAHEQVLGNTPPGTAIVFFINHRSNMDYLLVTYLASGSAALSYGAGEWARVWPFRSVLRLAGAYIIRRNTADPLYRKVLERYVQLATESCVPHAIFSEGKLSRNGKVNDPKVGLLGYLTKTFGSDSAYDIKFIPVGTNFDRVFEERTLIANTETDFRGRSGLSLFVAVFRFIFAHIWTRITGRWVRLGLASASFGEPLSLKAWCAERGIDMRTANTEQRFAAVNDLARELTGRIIDVIPVLAVPTLCMIVQETGEPLDAADLKRRTLERMSELRSLGAHFAMDEAGQDAAIDAGLKLLTDGRLIVEDRAGVLTPAPDERGLLEYLANSMVQLRDHLNQR
jgi:glycerol-3-phosphate O-acyltransferase